LGWLAGGTGSEGGLSRASGCAAGLSERRTDFGARRAVRRACGSRPIVEQSGRQHACKFLPRGTPSYVHTITWVPGRCRSTVFVNEVPGYGKQGRARKSLRVFACLEQPLKP
jgi:hypothetical protein